MNAAGRAIVEAYRPQLGKPPRRHRGALTFSATHETLAVDRSGGRWGAGIITGFSVITRGEALGHELWCDAEFLQQVGAAFSSAGRGIKSRFTHPDMSGDGLGHYLGRVDAPRWSDDGLRVLADLHLSKSAHATPEGDLASYVMDLAAEDPSAFGASIAFDRDPDAETEFWAAQGEQSPDPANQRNLPHARLARLWAVDLVDDPAANPEGLFHSPIMRHADALAAYALGLSGACPGGACLGIDVHPDRLRDFAARFLRSHHLRVIDVSTTADLPTAPTASCAAATKEAPATPAQPPAPGAAADPVADPDTEVETPDASAGESTAGEGTSAPGAFSPTEPAGEALDALRRYLELFGDAGGRYLAAGLTLEAALVADRDALQGQLREVTAQLAAVQAQLAAGTDRHRRHDTRHLEESSPLRNSPERANGKPARFADLFRLARR